MKLLKILLVITSLTLVGISSAYAEEFLISKTSTANDIIFDGKWTFATEWKHSSLYDLQYDDGRIVVRLSHDFENIYVLLDVLTDRTKSHIADSAMICFDTNVDGGNFLNNDDFCFQAAMDSSNPKMFQGGSNSVISGNLKNIENHPDLITVGGFSDNNDRYSKIPHATYEYKIPIEIIGYSDVYGFYIQVFDADKNIRYTWPEGSINEKFPYISSPDKWGKLISPDKSIPEFEFPLLLSIPAFLMVIYFSKKKFLSKELTA